MHGCRSRSRVTFDGAKSKVNQKHHCDDPNCFYFERGKFNTVSDFFEYLAFGRYKESFQKNYGNIFNQIAEKR